MQLFDRRIGIGIDKQSLMPRRLAVVRRVYVINRFRHGRNCGYGYVMLFKPRTSSSNRDDLILGRSFLASLKSNAATWPQQQLQRSFVAERDSKIARRLDDVVIARDLFAFADRDRERDGGDV